MESKRQSASSGDCMSKSLKENSSVVDLKMGAKTDDLSSPTDPKRHCPDSRDRASVVITDVSSRIGLGSDPKTDFSSNTTGLGSGSSALQVKRHGKGVVSDERSGNTIFFADVTQGPHQTEVCFRLIHFWEARNPHTKLLIGKKMLLIDEKGTAIQGFIPAGRVDTYLPLLKAGCVYRLRNFFGSSSKENYRVADHKVTVTLSWNSVLTPLKYESVPIPEDRFRFRGYDEFEASCDRKGDLYDYLGHMKLVEGLSITDCPRLDQVDFFEAPSLDTCSDAWMYLWDKAAEDFCQKFKSNGNTLSVILVTTVNPKRLGGTLALSSMSSTRVFMDADVHATREYYEWLSSNLDIANKVNAEVVTKPESMTLNELFTYIKQENPKVAKFECTATIDDVLRGSAWYYISCPKCHSKATKSAKSLMCTNVKCNKSEVIGVPEYNAKVSVYDKSEQAVFAILGDAGRELTGKNASELVANYFENHEEVGADDAVPVPQALMETIGQTRKFIVKVSDYNFSGKSQAITATKVLPSEPPTHPIEDVSDEQIGEVSGGHSSEEFKSG